MKRVRGLTKISFLTAVLTMVMFSLSFAVDIQKAPTGTVSLPTRADLAVIGIYAFSCKCDLPEFDMFFMNRVEVGMSKTDISTPAAAMREPSVVVGILTVTYYNPITRRDESQRVMLQNHHFGAGGIARIEVIRSPILVRKSTGIRAEIQLNSPGYAQMDPNAANNVMTVKKCEVFLE
jgi:hypothetical protein